MLKHTVLMKFPCITESSNETIFKLQFHYKPVKIICISTTYSNEPSKSKPSHFPAVITPENLLVGGPGQGQGGTSIPYLYRNYISATIIFWNGKNFPF
jgi:hypothetical protein